MPGYLFNGMYVQSDEPVLPGNSFSVMYGAGVFETMHFHHKVYFFDDHYERLTAGLRTLNIPVSQQLQKELLFNTLLQCAALFGNPCKLKIIVLKKSNADPDCIIIPSELPVTTNTFLKVDFSKEIQLHPSPISFFKNNNYLHFIWAAEEAKHRGLDDVILLNAHNYIADASISNIFCKIGDTWFTPPQSDGGISGVYKKQILKSQDYLQIRIEEKSISKEDLLNADEMFLTNVLRGVRIVGSFGTKELKTTAASVIKNKMYALLNY